MKFDFIIGNPPYQEETDIISETNGQLRRKSIFHFFQMGADNLAKIGTFLSILLDGGFSVQGAE